MRTEASLDGEALYRVFKSFDEGVEVKVSVASVFGASLHEGTELGVTDDA